MSYCLDGSTHTLPRPAPRKSFYVPPEPLAVKYGNLTIGFREELLIQASTQTFDLPLRERSESYLEAMTGLGEKLVRLFAEIPGIRAVKVSRHDMELYLCQAYKWRGDVGPKVRTAIVHAFSTCHLIAVERRHRSKKNSGGGYGI